MRNFDGFLCVEDADRLPPFKSETPKSRENSRFWAGSDYTLHPTGTTNLTRLSDCLDAASINLTREEWYEVYKAAGNILP